MLCIIKEKKVVEKEILNDSLKVIHNIFIITCVVTTNHGLSPLLAWLGFNHINESAVANRNDMKL